MNAAAIQRFAILLTLVGGILHIEGVIQSNFYGLPSYGMPLISLSVSLLWRRLLVSHSAVSRMVLSASFPGFRNTSRRS